MNKEMKREATFYKNMQLDIRSAHDSNELQTRQIDSLLNEGIDLLVVCPNEGRALSPAVDRDRHQPRAADTRRRRYSEIRHFPLHDPLCSLFCPHAVKGAYARLPLLAGLPHPSLRDIRLGSLCRSRFQSLHLEGHCRDALGNRKGA